MLLVFIMENKSPLREIDNYFLSKKIRGIIIGDVARKRLYKKIFKKELIDNFNNFHFDILLNSNYSLKETKKIILKFISFFNLKLHKNKISYWGIINNLRVELVGVLIRNKIYYLNFKPIKVRPDISIERIGFYNNNDLYDEYKRGFEDFKKKKIVINPLFKKKKISLEKALKIIQIKFQTNFHFDKKTRRIIINSLNGIENEFLILLINKRSKNNFHSVNEIKELILQEKA